MSSALTSSVLDFRLAALIIFAALLHSGWNALVKADGDRLISFGVLMLLPGVICAFLVPFVPWPEAAAWKWLFISTFVHTCYYFGLLGAYARGDMAQVYPIARGLGPLLVALASGTLIGEHLSLREFAGVALIFAGLLGLAFSGGIRALPLKALGFAVFTGATIASYTLLDGIGARAARDPLAYIVWLNIFESPWVFAYALWRRGTIALTLAKGVWKKGLMGGVIASSAYAIPVWAMSLGPIAHIAALREVSVLFGAIMGAVILREPFGLRRIVSAAVLALGLMVMNVRF